jgi:hypothetical protein
MTHSWTSGWVSPAIGRPGSTTRRPTPARCADDSRQRQRDPFPRLRCRRLREPVPILRRSGETATNGGLFDTRVGNGRCEVVCFTPDHNATLSALPTSRMRTVIEAWADRTAELSAQPGVEQVFCFENRGVEIGVTLAHPHGQIYGYPFATPKTAAAIRSVRAHRTANGTSGEGCGFNGRRSLVESALGKRSTLHGTALWPFHWRAAALPCLRASSLRRDG